MNKNQIRQFKNILRDYNFYEQNLIEIEEEINYLYQVASGYSGIKFDSVKVSKDDEYIYNLFDKIDKLKKKQEAYKYFIDYVNFAFSKMTENTKNAVIKIYINGELFEKVAQEYNYSTAGLFKIIEKELKKI